MPKARSAPLSPNKERRVVVDGESGLLVEPGNVTAVREALRLLLLDPARRTQMGMIGRQRARLFRVSAVADRIEKIYVELLEDSAKSGLKPPLAAAGGIW